MKDAIHTAQATGSTIEGMELASEALKRAEKALRRGDVRDSMMGALCDGSIKASAVARMQDYDNKLVPSSADLPDTRTRKTRIWLFGNSVTVTKYFFLNRQRSAYTNDEEEWELSRFTSVDADTGILISTENKPPLTLASARFTLYGVQFLSSDVDAFIEARMTNGAKERRTARAGESGRYQGRIKLTASEWAIILKPLVDLADRGALGNKCSVAGYGAATSVMNAIRELFVGQKEPSDPTLLRRARKLLDLNEAALAKLRDEAT